MMTDETIEVKIFMKDGQRKFGVLLDGLSAVESKVESFKFVCNSKIQTYLKTANCGLIEMLPINEVKVVETYLR
ncbi:MAG TPA: hypothetical protein PK323_03815 [Bacteroidia bacterium]|nr:hypothetical protein [Bacteroidia bacterium]